MNFLADESVDRPIVARLRQDVPANSGDTILNCLTP
jgi:hypothetical protein